MEKMIDFHHPQAIVWGKWLYEELRGAAKSKNPGLKELQILLESGREL